MKKNYIQKRGARTSRKKFLNALAKVPHAEPADYDRLPEVKSKPHTKSTKARR